MSEIGARLGVSSSFWVALLRAEGSGERSLEIFHVLAHLRLQALYFNEIVPSMQTNPVCALLSGGPTLTFSIGTACL